LVIPSLAKQAGQSLEDFEGPPEIDSMGMLRKPGSGRSGELDEVEILGTGRDQATRLRRGELKGIQVAVSRSAGVFVYEVKIPLAKSEAAPFAAESAAGQSLGIGFEEGRPEFAGPGAGGEGVPGGMGPGGMGGFGGRGGMGYPGRRMGTGGSLKLWLKVRLAAAPSGR
jgi:hypothetical protein